MKAHSPRACHYHFWKTSRIISLLITKLAEGVVAKGLVAVKKLSNVFAIHETKFHEEVACLMMAKHKNIVVRFLGYCSDTQGKMEKYKGNLVMADQRNWCSVLSMYATGVLISTSLVHLVDLIGRNTVK